MTYRGAPASALTGPNVVSVTFSFSNTVVAPPVFQTAAPGNGESHWPVPASRCDNLVIVTDHKPLIKIFGDRTLDEITNSRLFRLKQRTLPWRFEIRHLPGTSNHAADATSRHPSQSSTENTVSLGSPSFPDIAELALMNTIRNDTQELGAISWSLFTTETAASLSTQKRAYSSTRTVSSSPHPYAAESYRISTRPIKGPPRWNSEPAPSSTGRGYQRTSAKLGRDAQTAIETHPHRLPPPLSHLHHHYPHSKPSSQTSLTTEAAITWS